MLGNQHDIRAPAFGEIDKLGPQASETYSELHAQDPGKARSVARYFLDMDMAVTKCRMMLKPGGMVVFVIGNTQYKGVKIDNTQHLKNCMNRAGFNDLEIIPRKVSLKIMTPYRDERGRFTRDSTKREVYAEEYVVIGRK